MSSHRKITNSFLKSNGFSAISQTLLSKVFILAINLAASILVARSLGAEGRGEQAVITFWPQFLAFTMTLGLPSALVYSLKTNQDKRKEYFSATIFLACLAGIIACLLGITFVPFFIRQYPSEIIISTQIFILVTPLILLNAILNAVCESEGQFSKANIARSFVPFLTLIILVLLLATKKISPATTSAAYLLPNIVIFGWLLSQIDLGFSWKIKDLREKIRKLLSYGIRAYGIDLLGVLVVRVDQAFVIGLLSPKALGIYVIVLRLGQMLNIIQSSVSQVLFPKAAGRPIKQVISLVSKSVKFSSLLCLIGVTILFLFGDEIISILYGKDFLSGVLVLKLVAVETLFRGITMILARGFMALGKPGVVSFIQGIGLGLTVLLMNIFIPIYGLNGAGYALLLSTAARMLAVIICYPIILKESPPNMFFSTQEILGAAKKITTKL